MLGLPSQCNPAIRLQWARETADWPSWFYIPRPFCAPIAMGFHDCTLIAVGLEMAIGLAGLQELRRREFLLLVYICRMRVRVEEGLRLGRVAP